MSEDCTTPAGFDSKKRESLLKMAKISAFAVPTIATFSLDSVRNAAHAQESTTTPTVTSFTVSKITFPNGFVGFSKAMDTSRPCIQWTFAPAYTGAWNLNTNYGWNGNQHYYFSLASTFSGKVFILINTASQACSSSELLTDLYGNALASYENMAIIE